MSRSVSRPAIVGALLKKEFKAYSRDTVYLLLTLVVIIAVPIVFRFLPSTVDETLTLAVSPPIDSMIADARDALQEMGATPEQLAELESADLSEQQEGLRLVEFDTAAQLEAAVKGDLEVWDTGDDFAFVDEGADAPEDAKRIPVDVGIAFPDGFITDIAAGIKGVEVTVYSDANLPGEIRGAMESFVREIAYQISGKELPVKMAEEGAIVLGTDRVGDQLTLQDKFRPLILFMVLLMETFSMSSLIATEVSQRTVTALLVTPAKVADVLFAKTIFGTLMSFGQALLVLLLVGGLTAENWLLTLVALLMGAVMFTGVALFVGSSGRDFMGQLFVTMMFTIPLLIPTFAVLFPGTAAAWVRAIPTYPIIDMLVGTLSYGEGWAEATGSLAYAAVWLVVLFGAGLFTLKRRVESL